MVRFGSRKVVALALAAAACGSSSSSSPPPPAKGTVVLHFAVADQTRKSANLKDPLVGNVYGALFLAEDVSVTGPRPDAKEVASVDVANVDLRTAQTAGSWTSEPLDPNRYVFVGFFDLDGNGAQSKQPDPGDPATVPLQDKQFDIVENQRIELTESFDIVVN